MMLCSSVAEDGLHMASRLLGLTDWKAGTAAQLLLTGSQKPQHAEGYNTYFRDSTIFL